MEYLSLNVPLEAYELTKNDHRAQRFSEEISANVEKLSAERQREESLAPVLAVRRNERLREALMILARSPTPDHMLMRWRVLLYCGHIVETTRHSENDEPTRHGSSSMRCSTCGMHPACIVGYEPLGLRPEPPSGVEIVEPAIARRPTRKQLEARIEQLEQELAAARRQA